MPRQRELKKKNTCEHIPGFYTIYTSYSYISWVLCHANISPWYKCYALLITFHTCCQDAYKIKTYQDHPPAASRFSHWPTCKRSSTVHEVAIWQWTQRGQWGHVVHLTFSYVQDMCRKYHSNHTNLFSHMLCILCTLIICPQSPWAGLVGQIYLVDLMVCVSI